MFSMTETVATAIPPYLDIFISIVRDSQEAQVISIAVFLFILLDIIFGVGNALLKHEFSSEIMRQGIGHKCTEIGMLFVGIIVDATIASGWDIPGIDAPIFNMFCIYILLMELGSLAETFVKLNPALGDTKPMQLLLSVSSALKTKEESHDKLNSGDDSDSSL